MSAYVDFSEALRLLKAGQRVQRVDWNAPGQYVVMMPGYPDGIQVNEATAKANRIPIGTMRRFSPYFMLASNNGTLVPWVPSTGDLLSLNWRNVEDGE